MVRTKFIKMMGWLGVLALLLGACSGEYSIGFDPDFQASNGDHRYTTDQYPSRPEPTGLQEILVDEVRISPEDGSSNPVTVKISGAWPGPCSQLAEIKQTADKNTFNIQLFANQAEPDCQSEYIEQSFGIEIPLNMVEKQAGTYTVRVNGKSTSFSWSGSVSK